MLKNNAFATYPNPITSPKKKSEDEKTPGPSIQPVYHLSKFNSNLQKKSRNGKSFWHIATRSKAGHSGSTAKTNQDSYRIETKFMGMEEFAFFGVYDGHGTQGHKVSDFLKKYLHWHLHDHIKKDVVDYDDFGVRSKIDSAIVESFHHTNTELNRNRNIYTELSGSTGVAV